MRSRNTFMRKQSGIALITTLLLLMLMSAMVVGFVLLVTEGQRVSGMNNDQSRAFYGAEAGMEKLTADLGALFGNTYAPSGPQVDAITLLPPNLPASSPVTFVDALGNSSYSITYPKDNNGNPLAANAQIASGSSPYQGMTALETPYTLTVGARTSNGAEVKLQRTLQTVGIPLFQFGIYCEGDCSFFPGPDFNFGGRVHTNGNLFLNSGGPAGATPADFGRKNELWLSSPVTVVKDVFRDCLSNTNPENAGANHPGSVEITKGGGAFQVLDFGQGSLQGCYNAPANSAVWPSVSASFNGNLRNGVKPLNLAITVLGNGATQPIDLIRRPVRNERNTNPGVLGERYFAEASLRILLSDNPLDITSLDCVSPTPPFNLADLAQPVAAWPASTAALQAKMTAAGTLKLPLAASGAQTGAYVQGYMPTAPVPGFLGGDGYWQSNGTKIITGYIKIDIQKPYGNPCGTPIDVTQEILSLGYAGRNINPVPQSFDGGNLSPNWSGNNIVMDQGKAPALPTLPLVDPNTGGAVQMAYQNGPVFASGATTFDLTQFNKGTCLDPHPNAVIRLERIRDNPSSVNAQAGKLGVPTAANKPVQSTVAEVCGVEVVAGNVALATRRASPTALPKTGALWVPQTSDFWPNVLFDTREGYNRQSQPGGAFNNRITLGGTMNYIELDVNNLTRWFSGLIGTNGPNAADPVVSPNNFVVYISDRRSNYYAGAPLGFPPLSPSGNETGEYGYNDIVNSNALGGCPDGVLDALNPSGLSPEDLDGTGVLSTYGEITFPAGLIDSTGVPTANTLFQGTGPTSPGNSLAATVADPLCPGPNGGFPWPRTFLLDPNEARQNPSALFRRAVKLVNGGDLTNLPVCPSTVRCGLTIATENPAYLQGDYNANTGGAGFGARSVAAAVVADAFTLLSNNWSDVNTFNSPFNVNGRQATTAFYRLGVVAGKGISFTIPGWDTAAIDGSQDFGTDGGVHNFMRYLERWTGKLNYQGSIVSLYYNRQATGLFNSGGNNYSPPDRGYTFDTNFLTPALLPPRTPMFRDINTTGFTQLLLPTQ